MFLSKLWVRDSVAGPMVRSGGLLLANLLLRSTGERPHAARRGEVSITCELCTPVKEHMQAQWRLFFGHFWIQTSVWEIERVNIPLDLQDQWCGFYSWPPTGARLTAPGKALYTAQTSCRCLPPGVLR